MIRLEFDLDRLAARSALRVRGRDRQLPLHRHACFQAVKVHSEAVILEQDHEDERAQHLFLPANDARDICRMVHKWKGARWCGDAVNLADLFGDLGASLPFFQL